MIEYKKKPIKESEDRGIFKQSGPLLKMEIARCITDGMQDTYHPREFKMRGFSLPARNLMFLGHKPTGMGSEEIQEMYSKIFREVEEKGYINVGIPIIGSSEDCRIEGIQTGDAHKRGNKIGYKKLGEEAKDSVRRFIKERNSDYPLNITFYTENSELKEKMRDGWEDIPGEQRDKGKTKRKIHVNTTGKNLIRFQGKLNNESSLCLLDLGSEISILNSRYLAKLKEGRDYTRLEDFTLIAANGEEMETRGRIRIKNGVGLELGKNLKPISLEAHVMDKTRERNDWDILLGIDFQESIGTTTTRVEEFQKPYVMIENTKKLIERKDGKIVDRIVLDTLMKEAMPVYSNQTMTIKKGKTAWIHSTNDCSAQFFKIYDPKVEIIDLVKNFEVIGGRIKRNIYQRDKIPIANRQTNSVTVRKGELIAYEVRAAEAILKTHDVEGCGMKGCEEEIKDGKERMMTESNRRELEELINKEIKEQSDREANYWMDQYRDLLEEFRELEVIDNERRDELLGLGESCTVHGISTCVGRFKEEFRSWKERKEDEKGNSARRKDVQGFFKTSVKKIEEEMEKWSKWYLSKTEDKITFPGRKTGTGHEKGGKIIGGKYSRTTEPKRNVEKRKKTKGVNEIKADMNQQEIEEQIDKRKGNGEKCRKMILDKMDKVKALPSDLLGVRNVEEQWFTENIEEENWEEFSSFAADTSIYDAETFKIAENAEGIKGRSEYELMVNNYRLIKMGRFYHEHPTARIKLKIIFYKNRNMFSNHKYHLGRVRRSFFVHRAEFKNSRFHNCPAKPFRINPLEKKIVAKYLQNLLDSDLIEPTARARGGVSLFLVEKQEEKSSSEIFKDDDIGWKKLREEANKARVFNVVIKNDMPTEEEEDEGYESYEETEEEQEEEDFETARRKVLKYNNPGMGEEEINELLASFEKKESELRAEKGDPNNHFGSTERTGEVNMARKRDTKEPILGQGSDILKEVLESNLDENEKTDLGKPETQFTKIMCGHAAEKLDLCLSVVLSYRYSEKRKGQKLRTNIQELRRTILSCIREGKTITKRHRPAIWLKEKWS